MFDVWATLWAPSSNPLLIVVGISHTLPYLVLLSFWVHSIISLATWFLVRPELEQVARSWPTSPPISSWSSDFCLLQPKHTPHDSAWRNYIFNQWMPRLLYPSDNSETHVSQSFPVGLSSVTHSGKLRDNTPSVGCLAFPAVQVAFMSMPVVY